jgi:hypothetical protein
VSHRAGDDHENRKAHPIEGQRVAEIDGAEARALDGERRTRSRQVHEPRTTVQPDRRGHGERERRDRKKEAANAQGRQAHQHSHEATGERCVQGRNDGRIAELAEPSTHECAEADERELTEGDLPRISGQHHKRKPHDGEHRDRGHQYALRVGHRKGDEDRDRQRGGRPGEAQHPSGARGSDRGAHPRGRPDERPRAPFASANCGSHAAPREQAEKDHREQHQLERAPRRIVVGDDRLEHADTYSAGEDPAEVGEPPDHRRRQRAQEQSGADGRVGDHRMGRAQQDAGQPCEQPGQHPYCERDVAHADPGQARCGLVFRRRARP